MNPHDLTEAGFAVTVSPLPLAAPAKAALRVQAKTVRAVATRLTAAEYTLGSCSPSPPTLDGAVAFISPSDALHGVLFQTDHVEGDGVDRVVGAAFAAFIESTLVIRLHRECMGLSGAWL